MNKHIYACILIVALCMVPTRRLYNLRLRTTRIYHDDRPVHTQTHDSDVVESCFRTSLLNFLFFFLSSFYFDSMCFEARRAYSLYRSRALAHKHSSATAMN